MHSSLQAALYGLAATTQAGFENALTKLRRDRREGFSLTLAQLLEIADVLEAILEDRDSRYVVRLGDVEQELGDINAEIHAIECGGTKRLQPGRWTFTTTYRDPATSASWLWAPYTDEAWWA